MPAILGIDAAWTAGGSSGIALVNGKTGSWGLTALAASYNDFLDKRSTTMISRSPSGLCDVKALLQASERLIDQTLDLVAIDMPLARNPISYRRRSDDAISREFGSRGCSTHSPSVVRPGPISDDLRSAFESEGYPLATSLADLPALIEVYPHPALLALSSATYRLSYKHAKCRKYWPHLEPAMRRIELLEVWARIVSLLEKEISGVGQALPLQGLTRGATGAEFKAWEDKLDAVVCAWVGICYLEGRAQPYGDQDSAIWVPVRHVDAGPV